jgi:hypothetical protein
MIDYEAPVSETDIRLLLDHGWEISDDQREARLYSEDWSSIQAALYSTRCWIEDNREVPA